MLDKAVTKIEIILIVITSLVPTLVYWVISPRIKQRWQSRLRQARLVTADRYPEDLLTNYHSSDTEFARYFVGNTNCQFNAHSPYIRCAINPSGPCEDCSHYKAKD
jgi:Family of unknown function (DUF6464)